MGRFRLTETLAAFDPMKTILALGAVAGAANAFRFMAWAAVMSYSAMTDRKGLDAKKAGEDAFHTTGALGLIIAFGWLTIEG